MGQGQCGAGASRAGASGAKAAGSGGWRVPLTQAPSAALPHPQPRSGGRRRGSQSPRGWLLQGDRQFRASLPHLLPTARPGVPESVLTHPGPRRRQNPRRPARRRGRRRPQPERTDGLGSPLGLGVQMALGLLFQHSCLLPKEPPTAHQQSDVTSSRRLRIVRAPHAKAPQPGLALPHPFL